MVDSIGIVSAWFSWHNYPQLKIIILTLVNSAPLINTGIFRGYTSDTCCLRRIKLLLSINYNQLVVSDTMLFFATCPKNLEGLLEEELKQLGIHQTKQTIAGVSFSGEIELAYRACLWSRLANRILLPIKEIPVKTAKDLYSGIKSIDWLKHMLPTNTFLIDFAGMSGEINNTHFGAQKVKDAVVDQIRDKTGTRPEVAKENPEIRINVYLKHDNATIYLDLSGESLHRRGYRSSTGVAPIKENLAAAILLRANWIEFAKNGKPLLDPMCGSGTILIEAAMMACDIAPGLLHKSFGFEHWLQHRKDIWQKLLTEAKARREVGIENLTAEIRGYDSSPRMIRAAEENIKRAGLDDCIAVIVKDLNKFTPPTHYGNQYGVIVTNPPYGERLDSVEKLIPLYGEFGKVLREKFMGWEVVMITGNPDLGKNMGIRAHKQYNFFNGAIPCKLLMFKIAEEWFVKTPKN